MQNCSICNNSCENGFKRCNECNFKISRIHIVKKLNTNCKIRKSTIEKYSITVDDIKEHSQVHSNTLKILKENTTNINDISKLINVSFSNEIKNHSIVINKILEKLIQLEKFFENYTKENNEYNEGFTSESENECIYSNNIVSNHPPHYSVNHLLANANSTYDNTYEQFYNNY